MAAGLIVVGLVVIAIIAFILARSLVGTPRATARAAGSISRLTWSADDEFTIDGIEYACRPVSDLFPSTGERFCLRKPREEVERYASFLAEHQSDSIFELGIYDGGSTALIAQLAEPSKLIAVDITAPRNPGLKRFIAQRGLDASVRPFWEVDQADGARLAKIVEDELGSNPLDLVIDDASHLLEPTRDSFETLFPRLAPGGIYVIEDWSWAHAPQGTWPDTPALTTLIFELVVAAAHSPAAVAGLTIDGGWCAVERGPADLEPSGFSLAQLCGERGRLLLAGKDAVAAGRTTELSGG